MLVAPIVPGADTRVSEVCVLFPSILTLQLRDKLAAQKERREHSKKLGTVQTLGEKQEVDDLASWIEKRCVLSPSYAFVLMYWTVHNGYDGACPLICDCFAAVKLTILAAPWKSKSKRLRKRFFARDIDTPLGSLLLLTVKEKMLEEMEASLAAQSAPKAKQRNEV